MFWLATKWMIRVWSGTVASNVPVVSVVELTVAVAVVTNKP